MKVGEITYQGEKALRFGKQPAGALFRVIPEYAKEKEHPFTVLPNGELEYW